MASVKVVEDGIDRPRTRNRSTAAWLWLAIGFGVGLGFGVVFATPTIPREPGTAVVGPTTPVSGESVLPDPAGIGEVVEGFPDALVAVASTQARTLEHLLWPVAGSELRRPLPVDDSAQVDIDSKGLWIAAVIPTPGETGGVLSMGRSGSVFPLVGRVTSFAWHDSEEAQLAFTGFDDDGWGLWVVGPRLDAELVTRDGDHGITVRAWGDWGLVLDDRPSGTARLLSLDGGLRAEVPGVVYDSDPSGWVFMIDQRPSLVSSGGGVVLLDFSLDQVGTVVDAALSPDGERVAVLGIAGLVVARVDDGSPQLTFPVRLGSPRVAWSSDSRFVLMPGFRGVYIFDTEDSSTDLVLPRTIVELVTVIDVPEK